MSKPKPTWDDVLDELMLEESKPTRKGLHRWQKRYPEYRLELARYFAGWAQEAANADRPYVNPLTPEQEAALVKRGVDFAMKLLDERGLILPPFPNEPLKPFDQLVLTVVHELQGQAHAVNVTERLSSMVGREVLLGDTFDCLDRLEQQHMVLGRTEASEGKTRRYFAATLYGEGALAHAPAQAQIVADFLGDYA